MPTIYDYTNAIEIGSYYDTKASNEQPFLGTILFPAKKVNGLEIKWIKGSEGLPVALEPSSFDTQPNTRERIGFDEIETELPFFRESMKIGEKDRQKLNMLMGQGDQYINPILENIYDDAYNLLRGADVQPERMIMQLLSAGTIEIVANRTPYKYDYQMSEDHKETLLNTNQWSDLDNATPMSDIEGWADTVEENTGERPSRGICTLTTFNYIKNNNAEVAGYFERSPRKEEVLELIQDELGIEIVIYEKKFITEKGVTKNFFPDDVFTLIPTGTLGNTYYGTTPIESDVMAGNNSDNVDVQVMNDGNGPTLMTKLVTGPPVQTQTTVSEIVLPSFERMDKIFIGEVA